jgi:hypothetical protein
MVGEKRGSMSGPSSCAGVTAVLMAEEKPRE